MGFSIRELETLTGIKAHTIRIWEQRYRFLKPSRTSTNIRSYTNEELKTLLTVALLNKYGYKISRIDGMETEQRNREVLLLPSEEAQYEHRVNELIGAMIDLRISDFEQILSTEIRNNGLEHTITNLVFYFLEKIGILWQTGRIIPAHEHIVTNIIRQKMIAAIEHISEPTKQFPLLLLLLPENEHHELGLLLVLYLLKRKGFPLIYLGANVPLKDARYVIDHKQPRFVYMHLTTTPSKAGFQKMVKEITSYAHTTLLISGAAADLLKALKLPNVETLHSLSDVKEKVEKLTLLFKK